jgi:uncharacterized membrane protein YbaN (DUF454 family)
MNHLAARVFLAVIFTAIGVIGLIMPILPGWIFFGLVLLLLFPDARFARASVARLERHFPSARRLLRFFMPPAPPP